MPPRRPSKPSSADADKAVERARVVARLREERLTARAAILKQWEGGNPQLDAMMDEWSRARGLPKTMPIDDDRLLRFFCQAIVDDPRIVVDAMWGKLIFKLAQAFLEERPAKPPTRQEIADLVDRLIDVGVDPNEARRGVAATMQRAVPTVAKIHQQLGQHQGRAGRPKRS
jgi:hypothetical protein